MRNAMIRTVLPNDDLRSLAHWADIIQNLFVLTLSIIAFLDARRAVPPKNNDPQEATSSA